MKLTPPQFAVVMTVLWAVLVVSTVPLTWVTVPAALFIGTPASLVFFYSLANLVLAYMPIAEAKFNERFPQND